MKDYLVLLTIRRMAKVIIWIVEVYGELMKAWLKCSVNKVLQHCGNTVAIKAVGLKLCTKVNKG